MSNILENRSFKKQLCAIVLCTIVFMLPVIIKNRGIFVIPGDSYEEYYHLYLAAWEKVRNLNFSMFEWSSGLGSNSFVYSYAHMTSPFFWLIVPFPKSWIPYEILPITVLKFAVCYLFAYLWSSKLTENETARFVSSSVVTFSGWVFFYLAYANFQDSYIFFVLILYFSECFLQNNKFKGLIVSYFFLTVQSYYFAYMFVLFACLYALMRFLIINEEITFKSLITCALKYVGSVILGICLAGFILVPSAYTILNNPRLAENSDVIFLDKYSIFRAITSLLVPVINRFDGNYLISLDWTGDLGWGGGCSVYSLMITVICLVFLLFFIKKRETKIILAAYVILFVFVCFPAFWYLVQRTIDTRWFFSFVFLNSYTVVYVLNNLKILNKKQILIGFAMVALLFGFVFLFSYFKKLYDSSNAQSLLLIVITQLLIVCLYYLSLARIANLIYFVVCIEILLSGFLWINGNDRVHYTLFEDVKEKQEVIDYIKDNDNSFYRIIYDNDNITTQNEPYAYDYAGTSFYWSVYNFNQEEYLNRYKSKWSMPMVIGRNAALNQLSCKYWYTKHYANFPLYGYEALDSINGYEIYVNRYASPLAYYMDSTININCVKNLDYYLQDRIFDYYIVTNDSENRTYELPSYRNIGTFSCETANRHLIDDSMQQKIIYIVPENEKQEFNVNYYRDGELIFSKQYYQIGYFDFYTNFVGINEVEISFSDPSGNYDLLVMDDLEEFDRLYNYRVDNSLNDIKVKNDEITMISDSETSHKVYTSIAYDDGWTLKIDGVKREFYKVNMGFIGFDIDEGYHLIEFKYISPLFQQGCIVSLVSLTIFVFIVKRSKKTI